MSNLGRAVAGPEPTDEERAQWLSSAERILSVYSKLESLNLSKEDFEIQYDPLHAEWK